MTNSIASRLTSIQSNLPSEVTLVAVSKTKPVEIIEEAYLQGQRDFGENKVQELQVKEPALQKDIKWHMIGHLQSNKVKYIAPYIHLIHAVDSLKLLKEINKQAKKNNRVISCLLQIHIAQEVDKFGFNQQQALDLISGPEITTLSNIKIDGLMGMATNTNNEQQIRDEFSSLKQLFIELKDTHLSNVEMNTLSMGMSGDYQLAIDEGSTLVRIGSTIFGKRNT